MWLIKAQESVLNLKIKPALPKTRRMTESTLTQCLALLIRSWSQADSWTLGSYRAVNSCFLLKPVCVGFCQPASKGAPSILQLFSQNPARRPPTNGKEHERGSHPRQVGCPSLGGGGPRQGARTAGRGQAARGRPSLWVTQNQQKEADLAMDNESNQNPDADS